MDSKKIGRFICTQRKKAGLTQRELAEKLCVLPQTVSKWETGNGIPDLVQLEKMKEIFNCKIDDILSCNYEFDSKEDRTDYDVVIDFQQSQDIIVDNDDNENNDNAIIIEQDENCDLSDKINKLNELFPIIVEFDKSQENTTEEKTTFNEFFARKKKDKKNKKEHQDKKPFKEKLKNIFSLKTFYNSFEKIFGMPFDMVKKSKVGNVFKKDKKHNSAEFENVFTQGMFKDKENRSYIGITKPWACFKLFGYLLILFLLSLLVAAMSGFQIFAIIIGAGLFVLPMLMMMFEYNYPRNISILQVANMFFAGGLISLIFTMFFSDSTLIEPSVSAPFIEEFAKFITVIIFIYKYKPRYMLTGVLIGFAVGTGVDVFETIMYGYGENLVSIVNQENDMLSGILTVSIRAVTTIFNGHHYYAMIYAGILTSVIKDNKPHISQVFNYKVTLAVILAIILHFSWNINLYNYNGFVMLAVMLLIGFINVAILIMMLKIGIMQYKISYLCYCMKNEEFDNESLSN